MKNLDKINALNVQLQELDKEYDAVILECQKEYTDELHKKNVELVDKRYEIRQEIQKLEKVPEVGKYANLHGWTDVYPYEIVRVVSDKTLEIRLMKAELDPNWKPEIIVGGFAGHCVNNQEQKWIYESNPEAEVIRIRKKKDRDEWTNNGNRYVVSSKPQRFYDYNF